jgi:PEP-CTERM motif
MGRRTFFVKHLQRGLLAGASTLAMIMASAQAHATIFSYTGSEVTYTVPTSGVYDILAIGATGGGAFEGGVPGSGARAEGDISLSAGTMLTVLVGGAGTLGYFSGGGGGGSFVFDGPTTLVAAGGGGGAGRPFFIDGGPGLATTAGGDGTGAEAGAGGVGGLGGGAGPGESNSGGGAGVFGGGATGTGLFPAQGAPSVDSYGLGGGRGFGAGGNGGFGGGGGGGYFGGGGGGFSGGGGGGLFGGVGAGVFGPYAYYTGGDGGGGGGSYLAPTFTNQVIMSGVNSSSLDFLNGGVSIDFVESATPAVPEPSPWAMMLAGFASLGAMALRRKRKITPA